MAAGNPLPHKGTVFLSVREEDRPQLEKIARGFVDGGLALTATSGTAEHFASPRSRVRRRSTRFATDPRTVWTRFGRERSPP